MTETATIEVRYLSYREAMRYSGLSRQSLMRLIQRGKLRATRPVARRTLIDRRSLEQLMESASA